MVRDMTQDKPVRLILSFGLPVLCGSLLQHLYSIVDSMIVGQGLGVDALAAVGSVSVLFFLVLDVIRGLCGGFTIPVAQAFGAGDHHSMRRYIANSVWLCLFIGILMTLAALLGAGHFLVWMNTPANIYQDAYRYIWILFAGIPAMFLYNLLDSILRAMGDSRTSLYFLIVSSVLNILLDFLFILVLQLGTLGAAIATVISQLFSGLLCLIYIQRRFPLLRIERGEWQLAGSLLKELSGYGIPLGLQFAFTSLGTIILQSAVNSLGSGIVAAVSIGGKLSSLFSEPMCAIGLTMTTYCGQNKGAGRTDRIRRGVRQSLLIGAAYSVLAGILLGAAGEYMALLFFGTAETDVLRLTGRFLLANGIGYPLLSSLLILRSSLQGLGHSVLSMLGGLAEMGARIVISFALVASMGYTIICYTNLIAWLAANVLLIPGYLYALYRLTAST